MITNCFSDPCRHCQAGQTWYLVSSYQYFGSPGCLLSVMPHQPPHGSARGHHLSSGTHFTPAALIILLFLGHNFLLDSVVNNVINNITVELPSFTSDANTITTTTSVPKTTTEDDEETISNEIQANNKDVLSFNRVIRSQYYRMSPKILR